MVVVGVCLGSVIAVGAAQRAAPLLFHASATDPVVYAGVARVLLLVALIATWVPEFAAARVDPNETLRAD